MELVCVHRWGDWFETPYEEPPKRFRMCKGLCKQTLFEGDPEPRVVLAKTE